MRVLCNTLVQKIIVFHSLSITFSARYHVCRLNNCFPFAFRDNIVQAKGKSIIICLMRGFVLPLF